MGKRPIGEVSLRDVIQMVEEISEVSPSAARQAWIYTQRPFGWALNRDTYGLTGSPCERINVTDLIGSPKARERVLTEVELRTVWRTTGAEHFPFDPFVRLLMVLGCRRGELAGMRRDELDLEAGLWHLRATGSRTRSPGAARPAAERTRE